MKKKILIYGWFGENNIGDELLLDSMIYLINDKSPNSEINVMASKPKEVKKNHKGIKCISRTLNIGVKSIIKAVFSNPFKVLYNLMASDILIVAGGGAISDWNPSSTKDMFFLIKLFKKLKKNIYLFGIGVGPISKEESFKYFNNVLSKANQITVRDNYSLMELKKIGINDAKLTNDLVFNYPIDELVKKNTEVKKIGLVLAPVCMNDTKKFMKFVEETKKVINGLKEKYKVSIIPFQENYDYILIDYLKDIEGIEILVDKDNMWKTIDYFNQQDLIIGMRFHSIVLGLKMKKYVIPIVYHPKNFELIKEFELDKYMSSIGDGNNWKDSNINAEEILKNIELIQQNNNYFDRIDRIMNEKMKQSIEPDIIIDRI